MNIGKLDRKVSIQTYLSTRNQFGEVVKNWVEDSSRWCHFESKVSTSAAFGNPEVQGQPVMRSVGMFTFRNSPAVFQREFRIEFEGEYWHPLQIAKKGTRNEWTVVVAEMFDNASQDDGVDIVPGTNKTLSELVEFFNEFGNAETPEIQYMQVPVMSSDPDIWQEEFDAAGVPTFKTHLESGSYETKEVSNILHVARLDTSVPLNRQGQILKSNNEFGNTWRFTFDDGTRYHPYMSTARSRDEVISRAAEVGYTGANPAYCIDNLTGLAVLFQTTRHFYHGSNYTDATEGFEYYDPHRWWQVEADQSAYSSSHESDIDYWAYLQGKTIQGYSDWRQANLNEFNILMLASQDQHLHVSDGNEELQAELGLASEFVAGEASIEFWDRAVEGIPHAPWHSVRDNNLHLIVQGPTNFNNFSYDDSGSINTTRYYPVRSVSSVNTRNFANFTGAYYWSPVLVRRHFGNLA